MTHLFPALHEGHAPIHLHQAFSDALDAFEGWDIETGEPSVLFEGRPVPISSVFGRMRTCTDLLPVRLVEDVRIVAEGRLESDDQLAYADAARIMRALCVERLRKSAMS